MKNCKRRTIFSWIFAFVLLIPMFSIAVRCLYVVINKNAYQSYTGDTVVTDVQTIDNVNALMPNNSYELSIYTDQAITTTDSAIISYSYFSIIEELIQADSFFEPIRNANAFSVGGGSNNWSAIEFYNGTTKITSAWIVGEYVVPYGHPLPTNLRTKVHTFVYTGRSNNNNLPYGGLRFLVPQSIGTLDTVFESSVQQFVDRHGNGLINFFGLLERYFMQSNTANALYFTFANWCLNYVLLVSCVWLLFSVLMWFINYCNYMLNTSFRKGHGD